MNEDQKDYGWFFFKDNWYRVSMSRGFRFESIEDVIHEELQPCEYFRQYGEPRPRRKGACPPNCLVKKRKGSSWGQACEKHFLMKKNREENNE